MKRGSQLQDKVGNTAYISNGNSSSTYQRVSVCLKSDKMSSRDHWPLLRPRCHPEDWLEVAVGEVAWQAVVEVARPDARYSYHDSALTWLTFLQPCTTRE